MCLVALTESMDLCLEEACIGQVEKTYQEEPEEAEDGRAKTQSAHREDPSVPALLMLWSSFA